MKQEVYQEVVKLIDSRVKQLLCEIQITATKPIIVRDALHAPFVVDSSQLVRRLNAEFLGGQSLQQVLNQIQTAAGVSSLGELGDPTTLTGNVKLKEGVNVTIIRDDANNALEIAAQGASGAPSDKTYVTKLDETESLPNSVRHQDLSGAYLHAPKEHGNEAHSPDFAAIPHGNEAHDPDFAQTPHGNEAHDPDFSQVGHPHVEADITDLLHNAVKIKDKTVDDSAIGDDKILVYKAASQTLVYEAKPSGGGAAGWENIVCYPWAGTVVLDADPDETYTSEVSENAGNYTEVTWFDFDLPTGSIKSVFANLAWAMKITGSGNGYVKWQVATGSHASPGTYYDITDEVSTTNTTYEDKGRSGIVHKITNFPTSTPFTIRCLVKKGTATSCEAKVKSNAYLRVTYKVT